MERTIKPVDLQNALKEKQAIQLIDVRRRTDYDADPRTIPGAKWRDPEKVDEWSRELSGGSEVVIYCVRGGSVSNGVLDRLVSKKIRARYIEGGLSAWDGMEG